MGDSDDEFNDGRRRDKFIRERNDYVTNKNNLNPNNWSFNDNNWQQRDRMMQHRNLNQQRTDSFARRERYGSPGYDMPQNKRSRLNNNNWTDERYNYNQPNYDTFDPYYANNQIQNDPGLTQPAMMSFKQFMKKLDDSVDHLEAAKKYNEYKFYFKRKQITEFFASHKDEEWFRIKYHPEESVKRKEQLINYVRNRAKVFMDLYRSDLIGSTSIDIENSDQITTVLDSAVIKLEGGNDFDLNCLKENSNSEKKEENSVDLQEENKIEEDYKNEGNLDDNLKNQDNTENDLKQDLDNQEEEKHDDFDENLENNRKQDDLLENEKKNQINENDQNMVIESNENDEEILESESKNEINNENKLDINQKEINESNEDNKLKENKNLNNDEDDENKEDDGKPRPLHKTYSIFLRYLPANIKKEEIENMFKLYPEYLRVALADPAFDKRFQRRGWVTFDRTVDIRRIYLSLNNVRIRDCEVGAIINRDLSRRIRSVNGIASHKLNVLADIKHTTKIILNLDEEKKIWDYNLNNNDEKENNKIDGLDEPITVFNIKTRNPLLQNIENILKQKTEQDEINLDKDGNDTGEIKDENEHESLPLERDEELIKILDYLIFYLRIVHSLDYYNHINYPNEDEMPNRIGIMHARGMAPTAKITLKEVNDYIRQFENKISSYLEANVSLTEEELEKLGKRKVDEEIEKFIQENTKEIKKDHWLCPLSKKKFKSPAFVRKHIETKHADKLDEVHKDTEFFNLYLADPKRPQLPDHPFNRTMNKQHSDNNSNNSNNWNSSQPSYSNVNQRINFGVYNNYNSNNNRYNYYGNGNKFNRKRTYRDLDAPIDDM